MPGSHGEPVRTSSTCRSPGRRSGPVRTGSATRSFDDVPGAAGGRAAARAGRRPADRAAPHARHVRHRRDDHHDARGRPGPRDDRERVHVGLARAAARADLGRPPDEDVQPAARGPHATASASSARRRATSRTASRAAPTTAAPSRASTSSTTRRSSSGALAHFVADVTRSYWGGDHSLFLGRVEYARYSRGHAAAVPRRPLRAARPGRRRLKPRYIRGRFFSGS